MELVEGYMPRKKVTPRTGRRTSSNTAITSKTTRKKRPTSIRKSSRIKPDVDIGPVWKDITRRVPKELQFTARRPDDLLVFDLLVDNLKVATGAPPRLVKVNPNKSA